MRVLQGLRQPALLMTLAVALSVWAADRAGALVRFSGWAYDSAMSYPLVRSAHEPSVLLIETPALMDAGAPDPLQLLERLESLGASQVVFTYTPQGPAELFARARQHGNVIFSQRLLPQANAPDLPRPEALPAEVQGLPFGLSSVATAVAGIHRYQSAGEAVPGAASQVAVEIIAARARLGAGFEAPTRHYRVNFMSGPGYLPRVDAQAVLDGRLIPELVRGRSAVIGLSAAVFNSGLHTPLSDTVFTAAEFQALALDTLLQDRVIRDAPALASLLLLLVLVFASGLLYQWLEPIQALLLTAGLVAVYGLLAALALTLLDLWLPLVPMVLAQLILAVAVFTRRKILEDNALRRLLAQVATRVSERSTPAGFFAAREPWQGAIQMVNQALGFQRQIFLERIRSDHRVREVAAHNCSLEDIHERRRDYEREPYSSALAARAPTLLTERTLLRPLNETELQYLVPLLFAGELEGFWVFGVDSARISDLGKFLATVARFGDQIAEMMFHRREWRERQRRDRSRIGQALRLESADDTYREMARMQGQLERRLDVMEGAAQGLAGAFVLCDVFGNILHINSAMEEWARAAGLHLFELSALELAVALTGKDQGISRDYLRRVVTERSPMHIAIAMPGRPDSHYLLHVRPVAPPRAAADTGTPFDLLGILFEITDIGPIAHRLHMRDDLVQRLGECLGQDFAGLRQTIAALRNNPSPGAVNDALDLLDRDAESVTRMVAQVHEALSLDVLMRELSYYPMDPRQCIVNALSELHEALQARRLTPKQELPLQCNLVLADPGVLQDSLRRLLQMLMDDAPDASEIRIVLREYRDQEHPWTVLELSGGGYGFPPERLRRYLSGGEADAAARLHPLHQVKEQIEDWGGRLEGESSVGQGMRLSLHLRGHELTAALPRAALS